MTFGYIEKAPGQGEKMDEKKVTKMFYAVAAAHTVLGLVASGALIAYMMKWGN